MNVELKQAEIEIAIKDYMRKTGVGSPVESLTFLAGRRGNGVSASLVFAPNTTEVDCPEVLYDVDELPNADWENTVITDANVHGIVSTSENAQAVYQEDSDISQDQLSDFMTKRLNDETIITSPAAINREHLALEDQQEPLPLAPESSILCDGVEFPAETALFTPTELTIPAEEAQKEPHPLFG